MRLHGRPSGSTVATEHHTIRWAISTNAGATSPRSSTEQCEDLGCRARDVGAGPEDRRHAGVTQLVVVLGGDHATHDDEDVVGALLAELREELGHEGLVPGCLARHADDVHVVLDRSARGTGNLLELSIAATRARATIGEISDAMEDVFSRHRATIRSIAGVYGAAYEDDEEFQRVRHAVDALAEREGRRPRLLVVKLGQDGHDRGAKVIATAFADLGFDVDVGPLFQTPEEAARDAIENDVHLVGVSSQAAGHKTLIPELIAQLRKQGGDDILVVAGGVIPAQDYDELRDAGVAAIFGPGTNIPNAAAEIVRLLRRA